MCNYYISNHDGTWTHNLPIRRRTPYPLGHAVVQIFSPFTKNFNLINSVYIINILDWIEKNSLIHWRISSFYWKIIHVCSEIPKLYFKHSVSKEDVKKFQLADKNNVYFAWYTPLETELFNHIIIYAGFLFLDVHNLCIRRLTIFQCISMKL